MKDAHSSTVPPWARSMPRGEKPASTATPTSGSARSGPGAQPARAAGAEPPLRLSALLPAVLGQAFQKTAEQSYLNATREQIQGVVRRMVELDADKALACSALLAYAYAGSDPILPELTPATLSWIFTPPLPEIEAYCVQVVRLCPSVARHMVSALSEALQTAEEHAQAGV